MTLFSAYSLKTYIQEALKDLNFTELTPVQDKVLPLALQGQNLIVQSQTGSGKTHSFLIPIFQALDPQVEEVQAVITAPSRELATQLYDAALQIAEHSEDPISVVNYIGGTDKERQLERLQTSQPQVVIGTPGRIFDLMEEHALWVQTSRILVVDEADMTMDLGFLSLVDEIASRMPEHLQLMAFSATIPQELEVFLRKYTVAPQIIEIQPTHVIAPTITNRLIYTRGRSRKELTYELLTMGHPFLALVFCNTREYADEVSDYLKQQGLKVATIHGDIQPRERRRIMRQIRNLDFQFVVATDLAARGIDIEGVSMVINTELPRDLEFFVHRVGRTGRNGLEGMAYTMVTPDDDRALTQLENRGIEFDEVALIDGEIKDIEQRHRRRDRQDTKRDTDDPEIAKLVGRSRKKKVKPGYKRRLNYKIKQVKRQRAKEKRRNQGRKKR